jgi:Ca2+-transporting ATPase
MYHYAIANGATETKTRAFVFLTLMAANILLTLATRSFEYTIVRTIFYKNRLMPIILVLSTAMMVAILFMPGLSRLFQMEQLTFGEIGLCLGTALVSVGWFEGWKAFRSFSK